MYNEEAGTFLSTTDVKRLTDATGAVLGAPPNLMTRVRSKHFQVPDKEDRTKENEDKQQQAKKKREENRERSRDMNEALCSVLLQYRPPDTATNTATNTGWERKEERRGIKGQAIDVMLSGEILSAGCLFFKCQLAFLPTP